MDPKVFQWIGDAIKTTTDHLVIDGVANVIGGLSPFLLSAVTLFISIKAFMLILGRSDDPATTFIINSLIIIFITHITLNTANYTSYVINTIHGWESGLVSLVISGGSSDTVLGLLDVTFKSFLDQVAFALEQVDYNPITWGWFVVVAILAIAYVPLMVVIAVIIIGAQFLLTVLLIVGPLFISFAMFPLTRKYFDNWIEKVFEKVLIMVFGVMLVGFVMKLFHQFVVIANLSPFKPGENNPVATSLLLLPVSAILFYVVDQIPNLAGSLSGGFASANMTVKELAKRSGIPMAVNALNNLKNKDKKDKPGGGGNTIKSVDNKSVDVGKKITLDRIAEQNHAASQQ